MWGDVIFYLVAIIAGIAVAIVIFAVHSRREAAVVKTVQSQVTDLERIEDIIRPGNLGTPVDEVVDRRKEKDPEVLPFWISYTERIRDTEKR